MLGVGLRKCGNWGDRLSDYVVVWEFWVRAGEEARFEEIYGSQGAWARLFVADPEYAGTRLVRDVREPLRYLTLDFWDSREAHERFRERHAAEYQAIDAKCESLTEGENEVGCFSGLGG